MSDITKVYNDQIRELAIKIENARTLAKRIFYFRLFSFIAIIFFFYFLLPFGISVSVIVALTFFFFFLGALFYDNKNNRKIAFFYALKNSFENELKAMEGDLSAFSNGRDFADHHHDFSFDLDVFGHHSLFHHINRTVTKNGETMLAGWLVNPSSIDVVLSKQISCKELSRKINFRHEFRCLARGATSDSSGTLLNWFSGKGLLPEIPLYSINLWQLSMVAMGIYSILGGSNVPVISALIINFIVLFIYKKKLTNIHGQTSQSYALIHKYSKLMRKIEEEEFETEYLKKLQEKLYKGGIGASEKISQLAFILKQLDLRLNIYFHTPLNLFFIWDVFWSRKLESWKANHKDFIHEWFGVMSELDALNSLGNFAFNNSDFIFPEVIEDFFQFNAEYISHPLIKKDKRVYNDFVIQEKGIVGLITGSNMAGKSTFLRTIGTNMILAFAGAPVCAKKLKLSLTGLYSSMRVLDSLEENASSFYAELKKIHGLINKIRSNEKVFFLLDEILRGTNSNDRHRGGAALIRQIIKHKGTGLLATHDLELSKLEMQFPFNLKNYSFDSMIEDDKLFFDYKLKPGVSHSLNATLLMKKMGIEMEGNYEL